MLRAFETPVASVDLPEPQGPDITMILFSAREAEGVAHEVARKWETNLETRD